MAVKSLTKSNQTIKNLLKQLKITCLRFGYCVTFDISQTIIAPMSQVKAFGYCVTFDISQTRDILRNGGKRFWYCVTSDKLILPIRCFRYNFKTICFQLAE